MFNLARSSVRSVLVRVGSLAVACCLFAPAAVALDFDIIAKSGDPAPFNDGVYSGGPAINFRAPTINDLNQVVWYASLSGSSTGSQIITLAQHGQPLGEVARSNTAAPATFGNVLYDSVSGGSYTIPALSQNGTPAFHAALSTPTSATDLAIARGYGPYADLVAKEGQNVGGSLYPLQSRNLAINTAGQVAFGATLYGSTTDNAGIFRFDDVGQALVPIVRDNQNAPTAGTFNLSTVGAPMLNESGKVAFFAGISGSGTSFDQGLFVGDGGNSFTTIARTNSSAPDGGYFTANFYNPAFNDRGEVAFYNNRVENGLNDYYGIFIGSGGGTRTVARSGTPIGGGDWLYGFNGNIELNNAGTVAFRADTANELTGAGTHAGLFLSSGGTPTTIALRGMATPDGDAVFNSSAGTFALNDAGQVAFEFGITEDPNGASVNRTGLYLYDPAIGVQEIARTGQALLGSTIASLELYGTSGYTGMVADETSGLNNRGAVAFRYVLANGDEGIATTKPIAPEWKVTKIYLAEGETLPVLITPKLTPIGPSEYIEDAGSMAGGTLTASEREALKEEVLAAYARSGAHFIEFVDDESEADIKAFIAENPLFPGWTLNGLSRRDHYNKDKADDGSVENVYLFRDTTGSSPVNIAVMAETFAHELGHTFGLTHVDPDSSLDPGNKEIMDYDHHPSIQTEFVNAVSPVIDYTTTPPTEQDYDHNPRYHLLRWGGGYDPAFLNANDIKPGFKYDLKAGGDRLRYTLNYIGPFAPPVVTPATSSLESVEDFTLYDVALLVGMGEVTETRAVIDEITVAELDQLLLEISIFDGFTLYGASTPGGDWDLMLTNEDPYNDPARINWQAETAYLHHFTGGSYDTLATWNLIAITLPGDANNDGVVDANDFIAVEENLGMLGDDDGLLVGDANDDGRVDGDDFLAIEQYFGDAWEPLGSVPEPGTLACLGLMLGWTLRRRA